MSKPFSTLITDDNDRIYFVNMDWIRSNVVRLPDEQPPTFELLPTDDPNKYMMRMTAPLPKFLIKSVNY